MKTMIQKNTAFFPGVIAFLLMSMLFVSCKKDNHNDTSGIADELPDLSTKINSSVSGFVTNENNAPLENALVQFGDTTISTDKYGFFEIKNVGVVKIAAVVTVTNDNYFKAIKTYAASAGKAAFFRIRMIPKTITGTINSAAGGNVSLSNGLVIALPANGAMLASNGAAYTGDINVAACWINPEAPDFTGIMPGDLRGIDNNGFLKGLTTYGMAAVELTGTGGELLQVATGKKATITFPLSSTLSSAAPASIPLWHFDENNGLWKEEGTAVRTGNSYVGDVNHFSYWNCDMPNATVPLTFTVVDNAGRPMENASVEITAVTGSPNPWSHIGGSTDATGYVSVFVTANSNYNLEIYSNSGINCNVVIPAYTQSFAITTTGVDLGNIVLPANVPASPVNISGTITDCSGNPVTNGYLIVQIGYNYKYCPVDNNGAYNSSFLICSGSMEVNLIAHDNDNGRQSSSVPFTLVTGPNSISNIRACCDPLDPACPIDGGLILLIAAGIAIGAMRAFKMKSITTKV